MTKITMKRLFALLLVPVLLAALALACSGPQATLKVLSYNWNVLKVLDAEYVGVPYISDHYPVVAILKY